MNHAYGVRFSTSFKSEKNWYEINEYGGKALIMASIPIFIYGMVGLLFHQQLPEGYVWLGTVVVLVSLLTATWASYKKATEIDLKNH